MNKKGSGTESSIRVALSFSPKKAYDIWLKCEAQNFSFSLTCFFRYDIIFTNKFSAWKGLCHEEKTYFRDVDDVSFANDRYVLDFL